jgi:hypothetical protein
MSLAPSTDHDGLPARLLAAGSPVDAMEWLSLQDGVARTLGELTAGTSRKLVGGFTKAGAVVFAVKVKRSIRGGLDADEVRENTGHLVVQLPSEPACRAKVFKLGARHSKRLGFDPTEDFGQRLLYVKLD